MDYFSNLRMVVNTNLCGTWGAGVWSQGELLVDGQGGAPSSALPGDLRSPAPSPATDPLLLPPLICPSSMIYRPIVRWPSGLLRCQDGLRNVRSLCESCARRLPAILLDIQVHSGLPLDCIASVEYVSTCIMGLQVAMRTGEGRRAGSAKLAR